MILNLSTLELPTFNKQISGDGIRFAIGPFNIALQSNIKPLSHNIYNLYQKNALVPEDQFIDYHVRVSTPSTIRRFIKPQVKFELDGTSPFKPLPLDQSCAFFEWGLNWTIAQHAMQYLIVHCAVLEKDGRAVILPGMPGAGKSTLCAALAHHGWRLLSDEQALISTASGVISPLARPICLKNESIDIIKNYCPKAQFGALVKNTAKGDITHVKAPSDAIEKIEQPASPCLIVFPQFEATPSSLFLNPLSQGVAMIEMINHCFNYTVLGENGFNTLKNMVAKSRCYELRYHYLDDAISVLDELHQQALS